MGGGYAGGGDDWGSEKKERSYCSRLHLSNCTVEELLIELKKRPLTISQCNQIFQQILKREG